MAEKVVAHALFDYVDPNGVRRVALRGQAIEVYGDELARGEEHGAFEVEVSEDKPVAPAEGAERPKLTANKSIWLEFRGLGDLTEEQAGAVTLKELQDDEFMASYQRPAAEPTA